MHVTAKRLAILLSIIITLLSLITIIIDGKAFHKAIRPTQGLTLIIDAGHGGMDGGAVSRSDVKESGINLNIAKKLDQIMGLYGVKVVMTRNSEEIDYPEKANTIKKKKVSDQKSRVSLINSTKNAVLISIHQNAVKKNRVSGAIAFYAPTSGSKEFAIQMQQYLISSLDPQSNMVATPIPKKIYIMNQIKCPAILVECGFLSNPIEDKLLQNDEYRNKIAVTIAAGYLSSEKMLKQYYGID